MAVQAFGGANATHQDLRVLLAGEVLRGAVECVSAVSTACLLSIQKAAASQRVCHEALERLAFTMAFDPGYKNSLCTERLSSTGASDFVGQHSVGSSRATYHEKARLGGGLFSRVLGAYETLLPRTARDTKVTTRSARKTKKRICATPANAPARPPKPKTAATSERAENMSVQRSMTFPSEFCCGCLLYAFATKQFHQNTDVGTGVGNKNCAATSAMSSNIRLVSGWPLRIDRHSTGRATEPGRARRAARIIRGTLAGQRRSVGVIDIGGA